MQPGSEIALDVARHRHGRVPRAIRERQVLALAEELFAERGYHGTSMDEIARRAGVSKPVIYDLVHSKDELYRRVFAAAADELAASVAEAASAHQGDLEAQLRGTAIAFFRFIDDHRGAWAMLSATDGAPLLPYVAGIRARQARFVVSLLKARATRSGAALDEAQAEAAAFALNGAYEALAHWWRDNPDVPPDRLADWLVALVLPGMRQLTES